MAETAVGANQAVPAKSNIYGAGRDAAPMPGGGGGGVVPPVWELPPGKDRVVTISCAVGLVNPISMNNDWNGAAGNRRGPTGVEAFEGISGIVHRRNAMFLVGVFLTDATPADPPPPSLDFTDTEQFDELAPKIGQTFFVGDGGGRRFIVPAEATRLFLGFADAYLYRGAPGWYGNNAGQLDVTVEVANG